jgi:hypothetical protein
LEETKLVLQTSLAKAALWDQWQASNVKLKQGEAKRAFEHKLTAARVLDYHHHDESLFISQVLCIVPFFFSLSFVFQGFGTGSTELGDRRAFPSVHVWSCWYFVCSFDFLAVIVDCFSAFNSLFATKV